MKWSAKRQARRWVIQELTRGLDQRSEPSPIKSAADRLILYLRVQATSEVRNSWIEAAGRVVWTGWSLM
jgi:hypothetical protein